MRQEKRALRKQGYDFVEAPEKSYQAKIVGSLKMEGGSCVFLELQKPGGQTKECVIVESPQLQRWDVAREGREIVKSREVSPMERATPKSTVLAHGPVVVLDYDVWKTKREGLENEIRQERQREQQRERERQRKLNQGKTKSRGIGD